MWNQFNKLMSSQSKADNCPRENKNNVVLKLLCWLVGSSKLSLAALLFSSVGHTHGPLGISDPGQASNL